jgi:hypothetical protein
MNSPLFGIAKRLSLVAGIIAAWHICARIVWHIGIDHVSGSFMCPRRFMVTSTPLDPYGLDGASGYYVSNFADAKCSLGTLMNYEPVSWGQTIVTHIVGALLLTAVCVVAGLLFWLVTWICFGPSDYVDPCQDPNCPCARHVEEREEAEAARVAMIAATTAAVTTTIISSN